MCKRLYEAIPRPTYGLPCQVDFGETKLKGHDGTLYRLWFIAFVLSNSRKKICGVIRPPFYHSRFDKNPRKLFSVLWRNAGRVYLRPGSYHTGKWKLWRLIYTYEFEAYRQHRDFKTRMCRKGDPESKYRVENLVGFVKNNFAKHRTYYNLDKLSEECLAWLERTGNWNMTTLKSKSKSLLKKWHLSNYTQWNRWENCKASPMPWKRKTHKKQQSQSWPVKGNTGIHWKSNRTVGQYHLG